MTPLGGDPVTVPSTGWKLDKGNTFIYPVNGGVPLPSGATLTLVRETPYVQPTSLGNQGPFFPRSVEGAFDFIVKQTQQLAHKFNRTLRVPYGEGITKLLPGKASRAGNLLGFDQNGDAALYPVGGDDDDPTAAPGMANVRDFGAAATGSDDVAAFDAAAGAHTDIRIPAGTYYLSRPVATQGRQINWHIEDGASIVGGSELLRGTVHRSGRINRTTWGTYDQAAGLAIVLHGGQDRQAGVLGFTSDDQMATYIERDSVALYADNIGPPPIHITTGATYTQFGMAFGNSLDASKLKIGMIVDTLHEPKYSGKIVGWTANSVVVTGWYQQGNTAAGQVPPNTAQARVSPVTSVWAANFNVSLYPNSSGDNAHAVEVGTINDRAPFNPDTQYPRLTAYDAVAFGQYGSWVGYYARGPYYWGFRVQGATKAGFSIENFGPGPEYGLYIEKVNCTPFEFRPDGFLHYRITADGNIEQGRRDLATTPYIDFHSSGYDNDYDVRIMAQGGPNGTPGLGDLVLQAAHVITTNIMPGSDLIYSLGTADARWGHIHVNEIHSPSLSVGGGTVAGEVAGTLDFHSAGLSNDYDVRVFAQGGAGGSNGAGDLIVQASHMVVTNVLPGTHGIYSLGGNTTQWNSVWSGAFNGGSVNVSGGIQGDALNITHDIAASNVNAAGSVTAAGITSTGGIEVGTVLDLHSPGRANDYDVRLSVSGGIQGTNGVGDLLIETSRLTTGNVLPGTHNLYSLGASALRWNTLWVGDVNASSVNASGIIQGNALAITTGVTASTVTSNGGMEVGTTLDLHSPGRTNDYDVRMSVSAGTQGVNGVGDLLIEASRVITGNVLPGTAAVYSLGTTAMPYVTVHAQTLVAQGFVSIGNDDAAVRAIDFHTSGIPGNFYDARISVDGGAPGDGHGTIHLDADYTATKRLNPASDNAYSLGDASYRWQQVYAVTGTINTSDARQKRDIAAVDAEVAGQLVDAIPARTFKRDGGTRTHYGWVAQEVAAALDNVGISPDDFAGYVHDPVSDTHGLRQDQVLALLWPVVQDTRRRLAALEADHNVSASGTRNHTDS